VLSASFLKEKLGLLGKLGCAACLLGSLVLVLHAPPDREIQTIDEILDLAMQPCIIIAFEPIKSRHPLTIQSISSICHDSHHIRGIYDIQNRPRSRQDEPSRLCLYLFNNRLHRSHGHQGIRSCYQINIRRNQPVHTPFDLCLCCFFSRLSDDTNSIFEQGNEPILHFNV
jgi:Magnesium transporter NIPA